MVFLFYKAKCACSKILARLRSFARPTAPDRYRMGNLSRSDLVSPETAFRYYNIKAILPR